MMIVLKLFCSLLLFLLGWVYLYKSNVVLSMNRIARDMFFNDRIVLLERKKLATLFFCLSFVALYMGFSSLTQWMAQRNENNWATETNKYLLYMAMQDYCTERYENAIEKYEKVLKSEPNNVEAWKRMAYTYTALGEKRKARAIWKKILTLSQIERSAQATPNNIKYIEK